MQGLAVYHSMASALAAGYHVWDKTADGYLLRIRLAQGFAFALLVLKP